MEHCVKLAFLFDMTVYVPQFSDDKKFIFSVDQDNAHGT